MHARGDVRLPDYDGGGGLFSVQRNGIASAGRAHRLPVDGGGAVLANHSVLSLVEADWAANLAGIKYGSNFAVRFLVQPEANGRAILFGFEAVQIAVGNLGQGNAELAVGEGHFGCG